MQHVCSYYVYVCVYVCTYVCVYVRTYVCVCVRVRVCMYACIICIVIQKNISTYLKWSLSGQNFLTLLPVRSESWYHMDVKFGLVGQR